jgi:hypothetical protein
MMKAVLLAPVVILFAACGPPPAPHPVPERADPPVTTSPDTPVSSAPSASAAPSVSEPAPPTDRVLECKLPAPVKSQDACKSDADCGVSDPCHARACVAREKARPPNKQTVCTMIMDCLSADRNPCVCSEGVCALVPPRE